LMYSAEVKDTMAKGTAVTAAKPGLFDRIVEFYQDVKVEMSKVTWPSKEDLKASTAIVLLVLAMFGIIIGLFDTVFQFLMFRILSLV
jgi:preprotein translocase subunit SecE